MTDAFTIFSVDTIMLCGAVVVAGAFSALTTYALTGNGRAATIQGTVMVAAMSLCLAAAFYVAHN